MCQRSVKRRNTIGQSRLKISIPFPLSVLVELDDVAVELFEFALRFSPFEVGEGGKKKEKKLYKKIV